MLSDLRIDLSGFKKAAEQLAHGAEASPAAVRRAVNHTGDKARTQMRRALVDQTGLKRKVIVKALKTRKISAKTGGSYTILSRGGDVRLKFFGARETQAGVSAAPWNKRQLFARTFIKGGKFPGRVKLNMGGNVFVRVGSDRFPLKTVHSGLFIPKEMVTGHSAEAFDRVVASDLIDRIAHEILRSL